MAAGFPSTEEEDEILRRTGPGTPVGTLLRRYWMPVGLVSDLCDAGTPAFVRLLGENLVLFRDRSGNVGLLADRCAHEGASLSDGRVEKRGLSCPFHRWLFDVHGNCILTPGAPSGSVYHPTLQQTAYPVQPFSGIYWTYLGPPPAPVIPTDDLWVRRDGRRRPAVLPPLDIGWLEAMQRSPDPWIFPNVLRGQNTTSILAPTDDSHTRIFTAAFERTAAQAEGDAAALPMPTWLTEAAAAADDPSASLGDILRREIVKVQGSHANPYRRP